MYIARARCKSQPAVGSSGLNACWSCGGATEFNFLAWSSIAQLIWKLLAFVDSEIACLCQSIKINNNKHVARGAKANRQWGPTAWMLADHKYWVLSWSTKAQLVCQLAFSLLEIWCQQPWIWVLHSAEEDNLSSSNSKSTCLFQSIKINNNKQTNSYIHILPTFWQSFSSQIAMSLLCTAIINWCIVNSF